jgi:hypothetical protein
MMREGVILRKWEECREMDMNARIDYVREVHEEIGCQECAGEAGFILMEGLK